MLGDQYILDVVGPVRLPEHGLGDREKIGFLNRDGCMLALTKPGKSLTLLCSLWMLLLLLVDE